MKLDPRDLYALGAHRGGIDERWFSSTTNAANGPGTPADEGLSYIDFNGKRALLKEAISECGDAFLGANVMAQYGGWNVLSRESVLRMCHLQQHHARLQRSALTGSARGVAPTSRIS